MIPVAGTRKLEVGAEIATFANLNLPAGWNTGEILAFIVLYSHKVMYHAGSSCARFRVTNSHSQPTFLLHSDYCSSILPTHPHGLPPYICVFIIIITPPIPAAGMGPSLMPQMPSYLRRLGLEP